MMVRTAQPDQTCQDPQDPARLNLLLSATRWQDRSTVAQLPDLLDPLGIRSILAESGEEAADIISAVPIHIAVVDITIPLHRGDHTAPAGGRRILQLLRRLNAPPPTVVVRPAQPAARESARGLAHALDEGAFAVLDQPVNLETMLEVMRRVLRRYYSDLWPETSEFRQPLQGDHEDESEAPR